MIWIGVLCLAVAALVYMHHWLWKNRLDKLEDKIAIMEHELEKKYNSMSDDELLNLANERLRARENPPPSEG